MLWTPDPTTSKHGEKQMEEETNNSELITQPEQQEQPKTEPAAEQSTTNPQPTTQPNPEPKQEATETPNQEEKKMSEVDVRKISVEELKVERKKLEMANIDLRKMSLEELQSKIKYCEWGLEMFEQRRLERKGGLFNMLKSTLRSMKNYNFCGTPKLELFMHESEEGLREELEQYKAELKRRESKWQQAVG